MFYEFTLEELNFFLDNVKKGIEIQQFSFQVTSMNMEYNHKSLDHLKWRMN